MEYRPVGAHVPAATAAAAAAVPLSLAWTCTDISLSLISTIHPRSTRAHAAPSLRKRRARHPRGQTGPNKRGDVLDATGNNLGWVVVIPRYLALFCGRESWSRFSCNPDFHVVEESVDRLRKLFRRPFREENPRGEFVKAWFFSCQEWKRRSRFSSRSVNSGFSPHIACRRFFVYHLTNDIGARRA